MPILPCSANHQIAILSWQFQHNLWVSGNNTTLLHMIGGQKMDTNYCCMSYMMAESKQVKENIIHECHELSKGILLYYPACLVFENGITSPTTNVPNFLLVYWYTIMKLVIFSWYIKNTRPTVYHLSRSPAFPSLSRLERGRGCSRPEGCLGFQLRKPWGRFTL